jgi:hypothetical protein
MYGNAAPFFRFVDNCFDSTHVSHSLSLSFCSIPLLLTRTQKRMVVFPWVVCILARAFVLEGIVFDVA